MPTNGPLILAAGSMLDLSATALIEVAADAGFDGVGLRLSAEHGGDATALRSLAAERGIVVHDTEVHRIGPGAPVPEELIARSAELGARALLVVSDLPDRAATVAALADVAGRCRCAGLLVGLEYMAWTTPSTPSDAVAIAREVGGVAVVVDLLHHVRVGGDRTDLDLVVDAGVLGWVQLCDAPATAPADLVLEARHGRLPPGEGELPLRELLAAIPAGTPVSVEVQSDTLRSLPADVRARRLHDAARSLLAEC